MPTLSIGHTKVFYISMLWPKKIDKRSSLFCVRNEEKKFDEISTRVPTNKMIWMRSLASSQNPYFLRQSVSFRFNFLPLGGGFSPELFDSRSCRQLFGDVCAP